MRDSWREVIRNAEDRFWEAIAEGTPEAKSGDLAPDVAMEFSDACDRAARAWYDENVRNAPTDLDALALVFDERFKTYVTPDGTEYLFEYMYPGFFAFIGPRETVFFTPDWSERGAIDIAVDDLVGHQRSLTIASYAGPLSAEDLMALVRPWLDWTAALGTAWAVRSGPVQRLKAGNERQA